MGKRPLVDIAYVIDQSHNRKGKIEEMIQTVTMAQQRFAKVRYSTQRNWRLRRRTAVWLMRKMLQNAFPTDVGPAIQEWRESKGLPEDPMEAFRQSGYLERITKERAAKNSHNVSSCA